MKKLLIITLALLAAGSLHADTIVQTHNIATHGPGSALDPWTDNWTFDKFDTLGGTRTLNSVQVEFTIFAWGGYIGSDNDSPTTTANGSVSLDVTASLSSSDVTLANSLFQNVWTGLLVRELDTLSLATNDTDTVGSYQTGGTDWNLLSGPTEANANSETGDDFIIESGEGSYTGTGIFGMTFTSTQLQNLLSGGDVESIVSAQDAKGVVTVTYDYVPEPATASMMLFVGGLGFLIRRHFVA